MNSVYYLQLDDQILLEKGHLIVQCKHFNHSIFSPALHYLIHFNLQGIHKLHNSDGVGIPSIGYRMLMGGTTILFSYKLFSYFIYKSLRPNQGPVNEITITEVRTAISKIKNNKGEGPASIPAELWKSLKGDGEVWLCELFNNILKSEKMPDAWRKSVLVPFYKNKRDVQDCANYRATKQTSHTLKIWERIQSERLNNLTEISSVLLLGREQQTRSMQSE